MIQTRSPDAQTLGPYTHAPILHIRTPRFHTVQQPRGGPAVPHCAAPHRRTCASGCTAVLLYCAHTCNVLQVSPALCLCRPASPPLHRAWVGAGGAARGGTRAKHKGPTLRCLPYPVLYRTPAAGSPLRPLPLLQDRRTAMVAREPNLPPPSHRHGTIAAISTTQAGPLPLLRLGEHHAACAQPHGQGRLLLGPLLLLGQQRTQLALHLELRAGGWWLMWWISQ